MKANAGIRLVAVDRAADPVGPGRRRAVSLAPVRREPVPPRRAAYGPAAASQHPFARRHVRSVAYVVRATCASTVTSCLAVAGVSSPFARFCGQAAVVAATSRVRASTGSRVRWADANRRAGPRRGPRRRRLGSYRAAPEFSAKVEPVRWSDLRYSYRAGCPVGPPQLRTIEDSYWDFTSRPRVGRIVVARRVANDVVEVFRRLWSERFPIRRLQPVSAYRGSDDASMAADNTWGFNCRFVGGTTRWSMHAYGEAIDVNTVENPYVLGSTVSRPPAAPTSIAAGTARAWPFAAECSCAPLRRSAGGGAPPSATTSTSPPPADSEWVGRGGPFRGLRAISIRFRGC